MIGLCGVFLGVGVSFLLFACVGVECCALPPAPACGLAAHTNVGPGFNLTSPAKSILRFASHRTGNWAGKTEKRGTVRAFDKAGGVATICIFLKDADPTA